MQEFHNSLNDQMDTFFKMPVQFKPKKKKVITFNYQQQKSNDNSSQSNSPLINGQ